MKNLSKVSTLIASLALSSVSLATVMTSNVVTYEVTNFNGGNGKHALWTNQDFSTDNTFTSNNDLFFSVYNQGTDDVSDDQAHLHGSTTATGFDPDVTAIIDLRFSGGLSALDFSQQHYKKEGGLSYSDLLLNSPTFWTDVLGSIIIGDDVFDVDRHVVMNDKTFVFQFGVGANAKNKHELGGSSWVQTCKRDAGDEGADQCMESHHGDLNLAMRPVSVPEPGTVVLLAAGLAGLVVSRRTVAV